MKFSAVVVAAAFAVSFHPACANGPTDSDYVYQPGGMIVNGNFLPGPENWPGSCNGPNNVEQTPIDISPAHIPVRTDFTTDDYTFNVRLTLL